MDLFLNIRISFSSLISGLIILSLEISLRLSLLFFPQLVIMVVMLGFGVEFIKGPLLKVLWLLVCSLVASLIEVCSPFVVTSSCSQRLLLEVSNQISVVLGHRSKVGGEVKQVFGLNISSSVVLALSINISSVEELLVKHHNYLLFSFTNHSSSESEGDELSEG